MSSPSPGQLNHDTVSRLLDLTPAELTKLVERGVIPRVDRNAYALGPVVHAYINHLREEQTRIDRNPTQTEIAAHLDISDRRLRELLGEWGIDHKTASLSDIRTRYIRRLREEAAGRSSGGEYDLTSERARLAKEQADKVAMANAVTRDELAPRALLVMVLARTAPKVCSILEALPGALKRRVPMLDQSAIHLIEIEISKVRNEIASMKLSEVMPEGADDEDDDIEDDA
jgi:phage terminase Nu1 subunit (DNA packaging protein)